VGTGVQLQASPANLTTSGQFRKPDYLGAMCAPHRMASDDTPGSASCLPGRGAKSLGGGADARDIRECDDDVVYECKFK
jgi:hypothetical protein